METITIISALLTLIVGIVVGYFIRRSIAEAKIAGAKSAAEQIVDEGKREAESLKKEALLEAKDEIHKLRTEAEQEIRTRRTELQKQDNRLMQKEENLDRKDETLDKRETALEGKEHSLTQRQQQIEEMESKAEEMLAAHQTELERISGLTREEAKQIILDRVENELSHDAAVMIKERRSGQESKRNPVACSPKMCSRPRC
jgi:ribonuclease Y